VLLRFGTDSPIIDDGPAGNGVFAVVDDDGRVYESAVGIVVPYP
jgi:hypothetical protein